MTFNEYVRILQQAETLTTLSYPPKNKFNLSVCVLALKLPSA